MTTQRTAYLFSAVTLLLAGSAAHAAARADTGNLSVKWEELTAPDFVKAVARAKGTVILPIGILEKHGPHGPLGTDLINVRAAAIRGAEKEYAIVFPQYYFGQINEAKHQPGTVAYSHSVIWNLLQETCEELARNGLRKIMIMSGHGGNGDWLKYFVFSQSDKPKDYVLYLHDPHTKTSGLPQPPPDTAWQDKVNALKKTKVDSHAGEGETAVTMFNAPGLVKLETAKSESYEDTHALAHIPDLFTAAWWYARYPNHYAADVGGASREMGEILALHGVDGLARAIKEVKDDNKTLKIQAEFFKQSANPLKTKQ